MSGGGAVFASASAADGHDEASLHAAGAHMLSGSSVFSTHDQEALRERWQAAVGLASSTGFTALECAHALETADNDEDTAQTLLQGSRPNAHLGVLSAYIHAGPWVYKVHVDIRGTHDAIKAVVRYLYIAKQGDGSGLDKVPFGRAILPTPEDDAAWKVCLCVFVCACACAAGSLCHCGVVAVRCRDLPGHSPFSCWAASSYSELWRCNAMRCMGATTRRPACCTWP